MPSVLCRHKKLDRDQNKRDPDPDQNKRIERDDGAFLLRTANELDDEQQNDGADRCIDNRSNNPDAKRNPQPR